MTILIIYNTYKLQKILFPVMKGVLKYNSSHALKCGNTLSLANRHKPKWSSDIYVVAVKH